jgi:hypothetical protein
MDHWLRVGVPFKYPSDQALVIAQRAVNFLENHT